ncbi:MAG: hypothetical protein IPK59_11815 [Rhodospirillaceae bacterium]|nr:hypothetical protein [Rhodospirillaceae bacterium]
MPSLSKFLFGPPAVITTTLMPEQCSARCAERTLQGFFALAFSAFSGKPVMGEVGAYNLRWRKNSLLRDYFYQTELRAAFRSIPDGKGTRIECELGGGIFFWLGAILMPLVMLILFGSVLVSKLISHPIADAPVILTSQLIPLLFIAGILGFAVIFTRRDRVFLLDLLHQTVGGQMHDVTEDTASRTLVVR